MRNDPGSDVRSRELAGVEWAPITKLIDVTSSGNDETTSRAEAEVYRLEFTGGGTVFAQVEFDLCCFIFACTLTGVGNRCCPEPL